MPTVGKWNKVIYSKADEQFIRDNLHNMTNEQLSKALGVGRTNLRNKLSELGLKRIELEYWPYEAVEFLKYNFHKIGNVEICKIFTIKFPKAKGWTTSHIDKKMEQLGLHRTKLDWWVIKERNRNNGSYGKKNEKNITEPPKAYFYLNPKTRIELKPGQSLLKLKEKYAEETKKSI